MARNTNGVKRACVLTLHCAETSASPAFSGFFHWCHGSNRGYLLSVTHKQAVKTSESYFHTIYIFLHMSHTLQSTEEPSFALTSYSPQQLSSLRLHLLLGGTTSRCLRSLPVIV